MEFGWNFFEAFNIQFIPRDGNRLADSLAVVVSTFKPPINPRLIYEVEMRRRPSVPNNVKYWQVFEDDQQIKEFFAMVEQFQGTEIDQDEDEKAKVAGVSGLKDSKANQKVFQLKDNILPKGLVPLERLFNPNDVAVDSGKISQDEHVPDHNIGTQEEPKLVKLFNGVSSNYYVKIY